MKEKGFSPIFLIVGIATILIITGCVYYLTKINSAQNQKSRYTQPSIVIISKEDAAKTVSELPEVEKYIKDVPNAKIAFEGESSDKSSWIIKVYEALSNHNATYKWYLVNKATRQVTEETSNETESLKTYTNTKYHFSFKYPSNLIIDERYPTSDEEFVVMTALPNSQDVERVWIGINSSTSLYGERQGEDKINSLNWVVSRYRNYVADGAYQDIISHEIFHNGYHFIINADYIDPQLVLSTFKFTN